MFFTGHLSQIHALLKREAEASTLPGKRKNALASLHAHTEKTEVSSEALLPADCVGCGPINICIIKSGEWALVGKGKSSSRFNKENIYKSLPTG